jgi:hypothetical protein
MFKRHLFVVAFSIVSIVLGIVLGIGIAQILPLLQPSSVPGGFAGPGGGGPSQGEPTIEQIQSLATLLTSRIDVADVQRTTLAGYSGGVSAALIVKGDVQVGVDLSRARLESVDIATRRAVLILPPPTVGMSRVDHERTRLWAISHQGLWQIVPGERASVAVVNQAFHEAQQMIGRVAEQPELIEHSRQQAQAVLKTFFAALDWEVNVRWTDSKGEMGSPAGLFPTTTHD